MELRRFVLAAALLASGSAFQLRPCAGRTAAVRPALAQPPRILLAEEGNELPSLPSPFAVSDSLIQFSTLSDDYKKVVLAALEQSNKGRILSGMPVYPSVEGMVESYMEYEGTEKGMSLLEAEDEVVRYLQRKAARRVQSALLVAPQLAALVCWGWLCRLLAAMRIRHKPLSRSGPNGEAAVRP